MPDHLHALVCGCAETSDFHRFVKLAKQRSGFAFKRNTGTRLWQESFFDRTLRDDETPAQAIAYILDNPVRARIVREPIGYPYWGSQTYTREELLDFVSIEQRRV